MARKKQNFSIVGGVLVAILVGAVIGVAVHNPEQVAPGAVHEIDFEGEYDDSWGKLDQPETEARVRHILVSWKGKNPRVTLKDPERTEEEARALIERLWHKYRNDPTEATWNRLAALHSEDSGAPSQVYTCKIINSGLDQAFNMTGLTTRPGHARIASGAFGFHLIRRER